MKKPSLNKVTLLDILEVTKTSFGNIQTDIGKISIRLGNIEENMATKDDIVRIENNHERRIEILEDDVRVLKTTLERK
ncbi:hypothetical protein KW782_04980 [Candidatus Parcubacteria bacterium]|nr:hypothetical protein [Candidatus Parcubacteria bacterium]